MSQRNEQSVAPPDDSFFRVQRIVTAGEQDYFDDVRRLAIQTLAALAITIASSVAAIEDPPERFSLLGTVDETSCLLRTNTSPNVWNEDTEPGGCVLLTVPPLAAFPESRSPLVAAALDDDDRAVKDEGSGSISLTRNWSAAVSYHHELLFPTATSKDLRTRRFSLFSADENRDVLDLRLSWRVSQLSELDFGYQVQSNRASLSAAAESYSVRRFVSDADLDYALTIGITRRFNSGR